MLPLKGNISTHTLTWSVTLCKWFNKWAIEFQLTRSRGAWHVQIRQFLGQQTFQLTRSRGAWLHLLRLNCKNLHFNSHAHVERDEVAENSYIHMEISTHTLTWSVTGIIEIACIVLIDFNSHAHVERDFCTNARWYLYFYFNSHAHVERDAVYLYDEWILCISTHTLTWSVTPKWYILWYYIRFQLTRSRGAWLLFPDYLKTIQQISTHTLTWSVTIPRVQERQLYLISTHTLTWSVTGEEDSSQLYFQFQLTRSRGAWPLFPARNTLQNLFQLTRSRGAWQQRQM